MYVSITKRMFAYNNFHVCWLEYKYYIIVHKIWQDKCKFLNGESWSRGHLLTVNYLRTVVLKKSQLIRGFIQIFNVSSVWTLILASVTTIRLVDSPRECACAWVKRPSKCKTTQIHKEDREIIDHRSLINSCFIKTNALFPITFSFSSALSFCGTWGLPQVSEIQVCVL